MNDNHFFSIVERLRLLEGEITPSNVKHGLNAQQKSVPQMPALFKPKTQKILGGDPNAKNPMSGYAVGGCEESVEENDDEETIADILRHEHNGDYEPHSRKRTPNKNKWHDEDEELPPVNEDKHLGEEASEDMLTKVKSSFADYLQNLEDNIKQDKDLLAKKKEDFDLKKKKLKDLELQIKQKKEEQEEAEQVEEYEEVEEGETYAQGGSSTYAQGGNSTYAECAMPVVKTVTFEDGSKCTVHGDEDNGFIVRRGAKQLPSKFDHLDHALMALDMFKARQAAKQQQDDSSDYVEEK